MTKEIDLNPMARSLLNNKFVGILIISNNKIEFSNSKAEELFGLTAEQLESKNIESLLNFDQLDNSLEKLLKVGNKVVVRGQLIHESKDVYPVDIAVENLETFRSCIFLSPTHDRESFNFLKKQFFKKVTHELRSPLSSIVGALALIKSGKLSNVESVIQIARRNSNRLTLMINSILDIETFESGSLVLQSTINDIQEQLNQAVSLVDEYAHENNVEIVADFKSIAVISDHERFPQAMAQILRYLILKCAKPGWINVSISDSDGWLDIKLNPSELSVTSDETDLEEEDLVPSFSLNMAKRVIELHNGTLTGLGDTSGEVWLRLPIANLT